MTNGDTIAGAIRRVAPALKALALKIHSNPELGNEEHRACRWQVEFLRRQGFKVKFPYAGVPTAYQAVYGKGKPVFALLAEYDALPGLGHACGHNLICTASMGAGVALRDLLKGSKAAGTVMVIGTPAEESLGGKVRMVKNGAFKGIDVVMMAHPSHRTMPDHGHLAVTRFSVVFHGLSAHAAAQPQRGLNALDAVMLMFQGINAWRQQLPDDSRVHGIVTEGGDAPNIIPERASCAFFLRASSDRFLNVMVKRFHDIVKGAALMTGTTFDISPPQDPYRGGRPNAVLNEAWLEEGKAAGLHEPDSVSRPGRASTDFCDVQQVIPGSHVYFAIAKRSMALHSKEFCEAAGSTFGVAQMLKSAESLAGVGWRVLSDKMFLRRVQESFRQR